MKSCVYCVKSLKSFIYNNNCDVFRQINTCYWKCVALCLVDTVLRVSNVVCRHWFLSSGSLTITKACGKLQSDLIEAQRELLSLGGINCAIDLSRTLISFPFALTMSNCVVPTGFLIILCMIGLLPHSLDRGSRCCSRWRSPLRPTSPSTLAPLTLVCICLYITLLVPCEILLRGTAF